MITLTREHLGLLVSAAQASIGSMACHGNPREALNAAEAALLADDREDAKVSLSAAEVAD